MLWGLKLFSFFGVLWTLFPKEAHLSKMEWHGKAIIIKKRWIMAQLWRRRKRSKKCSVGVFGSSWRIESWEGWKQWTGEKLLLNSLIIQIYRKKKFQFYHHHQIDIKILIYFHQLNSQKTNRPWQWSEIWKWDSKSVICNLWLLYQLRTFNCFLILLFHVSFDVEHFNNRLVKEKRKNRTKTRARESELPSSNFHQWIKIDIQNAMYNWRKIISNRESKLRNNS